MESNGSGAIVPSPVLARFPHHTLRAESCANPSVLTLEPYLRSIAPLEDPVGNGIRSANFDDSTWQETVKRPETEEGAEWVDVHPVTAVCQNYLPEVPY